jgi:amino acid transporter
LPLLTFYGLGTILGAGIYVLIGEVTLRAQKFASISFIVAACIASVTAYSFARLSSMYPKSAGEAAYAYAAFSSRTISALVGIVVIVIGSVSAATMVKGFAAYFSSIINSQEIIVIIIIISFITAFSIWGISQSIILASIITVIEVLGLLFVVYVIVDVSELSSYQYPDVSLTTNTIPVIFYAAFISFYAYIGFEDIVNIAEETIDARRVVPLAILLSLIISTFLYVLLSVTCSIFIPMHVFENSSAPFVSIVEHKGYDPTLIAVVSMIAIINGALVQQIMAARVLYGMAKQKLFLSFFKKVNPRTRTPIYATIVIAGVILILSTSIDLITLAEITSAITLIVFIVVQVSLLYISMDTNSSKKLDYIMPSIGIILNTVLIVFGAFNLS